MENRNGDLTGLQVNGEGRCLKEAGVPRLTVQRVHAIGSGVDPATAKLSFREGSEYADKGMVRFI